MKEVLSYGLSPALYPYFFQKIDSMLQPKEKVCLVLSPTLLIFMLLQIQTYDQQTTFIDQVSIIWDVSMITVQMKHHKCAGNKVYTIVFELNFVVK